MRPDAHQAMRTALALGPGYCPPDLFAGPIDSVVLGLKAHANTISHARHVALEETFPRTRKMMGAEVFHARAEAHLADAGVQCLPLTRIGSGFVERLPFWARELAAVEFAWLEAHGAADAPPFDLAAIASLDAKTVISAKVSLHPACRMVELSDPWEFTWDGQVVRGSAVLLTRPHAEVIVTGVDEAVVEFPLFLNNCRRLGALLEHDQAATTILVTAGALTLSTEIML